MPHDRARTFEFVLHFVGFDMVTVSPNQIIIIIIIIHLRPDVAILTSSTIETLELTICHETNTIKSKIYKETKYANLHQNLIKKYSGLKLNKYTMEVSTLGVISDTKLFSSKNLITSMPDHIKCDIVKFVISKSFSIYCNRNNSIAWHLII